MLNIIEHGKVYDLIVAGGGISGTISALSAARNGAKVLIVEKNGYLGGALTACGVGPMMTFHAGEKQVILGIGEEIVQNLKARGYSPGHVRDTTNYISYLTPFSTEGMKIILDEMITEAKCDVLYHSFIAGVDFENEEVKSIYICNKDGLTSYKAKIFIDATGDADIANYCKVPCKLGRESDSAMQPMTMNMKLYNVDSKELRNYARENSEKFPRLNKDISLLDSAQTLSFIGFDEEFKEGKRKGELSIPREDILFFETSVPGEFIINTTRIIEHSGVDAKSISEAEFIGRKQCEELYNFLVRRIPGFKNAKVVITGPSIGVRGSRQICGKYTLTAEDVLDRKRFENVIAHSAYPIDIHNPKGEGTMSVHAKSFDDYYSIPYDIMVVNEFKNLLVTGRCVSATFEAQAAIRTTPTLTALGQAAGVAAALAVKYGDTRNIDIKELQSLLIKQGSYIEI